MRSGITSSALTAFLTAAADTCRRHARLVVAGTAALTLVLAWYAATHLGVNTDHKRLLASDLPFQKAAADFARHFPALDDSLLIVVDGETPERTREATRLLAGRLHDAPAVFKDVYVPGSGEFFERSGLLYRTPDELEQFTDHLARMQPVLAELTRDGSIANLAHLVRLGLDEAHKTGTGFDEWRVALDQIGKATVQAFQDYPVAMSWESLMLQGSALELSKRQVIIAEPVLEFGSLLPARHAITAVRVAAADLGLDPAHGVTVRITGNPALNYEEMFRLAWDVGYSSIYTFVLVIVLLFVAFRSTRLVTAAALTLIAGLVWTAAFAAAAVGNLNLISVAFAVLFIGLGIEFSIHIGMHFAERLGQGVAANEALRRAVAYAGTSLVTCAVTTAIGFFAFVPTVIRGIAELGLITGIGMFIILAQSFTVFPALVTLLLPTRAQRRLRPAFRLRLAPPAAVHSRPGAVLLVTGGLALVSLLLLPRLWFDSNVVKMRDPSSESVQAFNDLLAQSRTSPWSIDVSASDLPAAAALAERFRRLDVVERAVTLNDYVPPEQEEKRAILADAALLLDAPRTTATAGTAMPVAEQVAALRELRDVLGAPWLREHRSPLAASALLLRERLGMFLARVEAGERPETALAELQDILLGTLPAQVARLQRALSPPPVRVEDLPPDLARRMLARDGHARVQIFPRENLADHAALARFVDAVRAIEPSATGVAVNLLEFGRATAGALVEALGIAFVATALALWLLWRSAVDCGLGLSPLVLASALLCGIMVAFDLPFNFTNSIVLPLLFGIGADFSTHLVQRTRYNLAGATDVLDTTSARAVFYSAATTIASFGSLAFSTHRGIASMGTLLALGMLIALACNLIVLPALLELMPRRRSAAKTKTYS